MAQQHIRRQFFQELWCHKPKTLKSQSDPHYAPNYHTPSRQSKTNSLPVLNPHPTPKPNEKRNMDNRPAWLVHQNNDQGNSVTFDIEEDRNNDYTKKRRLWVISAQIFISNTNKPMPLDLDNGLPVICLQFGRSAKQEISFGCHVDTCAAMNTGNLLVHKWIMTSFPHIVAEYLEYNDTESFNPIQLLCAVEDEQRNNSRDDNKGKLTAIVRYWTQYKNKDGSREVISFGLGEDIAANSLLGLPTLKRWKALIDLEDESLIARSIQTTFKMESKPSKPGLPANVTFYEKDFKRPPPTPDSRGIVALTQTDLGSQESSAITDNSRRDQWQQISSMQSSITTDTNQGEYAQRVVRLNLE